MAITTKKYCTDWMIIEMIIKTTEKNFCGSTKLSRFYGAREDVRKLLANMVHQRKEKNPDGYCRGTECAEEVDLYRGYALQSYAEYDSCKVTFTALKYASICHILDDGTIR